MRYPGRVLALRVALGCLVALAACAHGPPRFDPRARPTCVVLSVGGPAGVAHLGALAALREAGIAPACVVGNSVGALIGALHASAPGEEPERRFRRFVAAYGDATQRTAARNGLGLAVILGGIAALATDGLAVPAAAAGGMALGAKLTPRLDHDRLVRVLDEFVGAARIEALSVPYATFFHEATATGVTLRAVRTGNLAQAVGASVANPLIFPHLAIEPGRPVDPGADRVAATPIEDACALFPGANLLAINVTGQPAFVRGDLPCPVREVRVDVGALGAEDVLAFGDEYTRAVAAGREATRRALR